MNNDKNIPNLDLRGNILLVDDSSVNLCVLQGILSSFYNLRIDTAISGLETIEKIKKTDYNIIFMDHYMPEMDGVETTIQLRELNCLSIIIACTSSDLPKEYYISKGFNDLIQKPINVILLCTLLNKYLK